MADIKLRKVDRNTIKTLDHAASAMHHVKDASIRTRAAARDAAGEDNDRSPNEYAQRKVERVAAGTAYAAKRGAEAIRERHEKAVMADNEVARTEEEFHNTEEFMNSSRIEGASAAADEAKAGAYGGQHRDRKTRYRHSGERSHDRVGLTAKKDQKPLNTTGQSEEAVIRQKKYGRRKLIKRNEVGGKVRYFANAGGRRLKIGERIARTIERSKALLKMMTAGGMLSVGIVVIMVLFGAAFTFNEDGSYVAGSGDATIVEVARGELGNVGGDKFWKWYGFKSHVDWCAIFVSWCADQCGYIETGIIPKFAVVGDGANWFKARHRWAGRGYKPSPGDIIFFDYEQDGLLDHVGIVESCDGKTVTTIEGNSGNACKRNSYSVGNSQIAGYGLVLIPGGGSKAQMIARKATQLAYPNSPEEAKYHGGKPTVAYAAALKRAYPNRSSWGKPPRDGASCDVFVGVCLVDSGVDKDFPRGYREQAIRLDSRKDLYECVISTTSRDIKESELKDGDIVRYDKSNGGCHIFIVAGGKAKQAGYDNFYPRTNSLGSKIKIKGKKLIRVYRAKG